MPLDIILYRDACRCNHISRIHRTALQQVHDLLTSSELKEKIEALAWRVEFPFVKLYVVENSKRSSHCNAYYYGFWKNKGIVLYDTMLSQELMDQLKEIIDEKESKNDQNQSSIGESKKVTETKSEEPHNDNTTKCLGMSDDEVVAILAHELGHWKLWHNVKNLVMLEVISFGR
ncbi:peptidase family m48 domain-containing protein [Ditylenchus destructor]|uniref:Peptidase family m48 domain-containing protein n=1 Tax=Ditylenchus destructor TaxID=166010 RepID=A0AAD4QV96_9BILA|nr:peptidase family m48 domain-containing protein [Ditylenchus destructor]